MADCFRTFPRFGVIAVAFVLPTLTGLPIALASAPVEVKQEAITLAEPGHPNPINGTVTVETTEAIAALPAEMRAANRNYRQFTTSEVGSSSAAEVYTLNFHIATTITRIAASNDFHVTGGTCSEGRAYVAGDDCTVEVTFTPKGPGHRTGKVTIAHSASAQPFVAPTGGEATGPAMSFIPALTTTVPETYQTPLNNPQALAVDGGDNLYIANTGANLIQYIDSSGVMSTIAGGGTNSSPTFSGAPTAVELSSPSGVAVDSFGDVLISDTGNSVVRVLGLLPFVETEMGGGSTAHVCTVTAPCAPNAYTLPPPYGATFDQSGNLFVNVVSSTGGVSIVENRNSTATGIESYLSSVATSNAANSYPIAVDAVDDLFYVFGCDIAGQNLAYSDGLTTGESLWLVAGTRNCGFSGDGGKAAGAEISNHIGGFAFDAANNFYFTDTGNNRVRRIDSLTGIIRTVGGTGVASESQTQGSATSEALGSPTGLGVDSQGNVYVTSRSSSTITNAIVREIGQMGDLSFPVQVVGNPDPVQTVLISNVGNSELTLLQLPYITGTNVADFAIDAHTTTCVFPTQIPSGDSCQIGVIFTPGALGARSAILNLVDNTSAAQHQVLLNGIGGTAGTITISPLEFTFSETNVGSLSAPQTFTVANTGGVALTITQIGMTGTGAAQFTLSSTCGPLPLTLPGSESCQVQVTFAPTAAGSFGAYLSITNSASTVPVVVPITGIGISPPKATLAPTAIAFAAQTQATTSATQTITLSNTGTSPVTVSSATLTGTNPSDFKLTNVNCPTTATTSIAGGATCTYTVAFSPASAAAFTAGLTVVTNAGTLTTTLSGTGLTPATAAFSVNSLTYGAQPVGSTSLNQLVTLFNKGGSPLGITSVTFNTTNFALSNSCSTTVAPGSGCSFGITFTPTTTGTLTDTLTVVTSVGTVSVAITGTGVTPTPPVLSPTSLTFAAQVVGTTSAAQTIKVTNNLTTALTYSGFAFNSTNFTVSSNTCTSATLAAGASCSFGITFTPTVTGALTDSLEVLTSGGNVSAAITGTGVTAAKAELTPTALTFAGQTVGTTSASQIVTLSNPGGSSLTITSYTYNSTNYAVKATTCGTAVAAGGNCTFSIAFAPTVAGTLTDTLTVVTAAGTVSATFSGTATAAPTASMSPLSIGFPTQAAATTGAAQTITLANTGSVAVTVTSATLTGSNPTDFTLKNVNCPTTTSTSVATSASCTYTVAFSPLSAAAFSASLTVVTNAGTLTTTLTGTGTAAPAAKVTPASINFGNETVGVASAVQLVTITNTGTSAFTISTAGVTGADPNDFNLTNATCSSSLAAGAACNFSVSFQPLSAGAFTGSLTITTSAGTFSSALSGSGVAAQVKPTVALTSRINPSLRGESVFLSSEVEGNDSAPPSGVVQLKDGDRVISEATLSAGLASFKLTDLTPGRHILTAWYLGDKVHAPSKSPSVVQVIGSWMQPKPM